MRKLPMSSYIFIDFLYDQRLFSLEQRNRKTLLGVKVNAEASQSERITYARLSKYNFKNI